MKQRHPVIGKGITNINLKLPVAQPNTESNKTHPHINNSTLSSLLPSPSPTSKREDSTLGSFHNILIPHLSHLSLRMKPKCLSITFLCISLILLPTLILSQSCQRTCGNQHLKYPFGSGPGCGDPRFQPYVTCSQEKLTFITHTGYYTITNIDYNSQVLCITDPSMSTCSCAQPSKGFGLDWNAPFSFHDGNVFALLDCSITSSPIYKPDGLYGGGNSTLVPLCDSEGAPICSLLYSCRPIIVLNIPISTCCVYTPVDLGPSFEMDLQKLKCTSYSGFYSYNGQDSNPQSWKYGVALKYKFSINNDYPGACADCEKSNGVCGYTGDYNSFICNCPGGVNTTGNCFFSAYWNNGLRPLPWQTGTNHISTYTHTF